MTGGQITTDNEREHAIAFALRLLERAGIKATVAMPNGADMVVTIRRPWVPRTTASGKAGKGGRKKHRRYAT